MSDINVRPPKEEERARASRGASDEQVGGDVEEEGEFLGLGFADGTLAVEDFGGDAL